MRVRTGRFTELPGRSRVMDLHPQFFDRYETSILQASVGQAGMRGEPSSHRPWAISVEPCANGGTELGTKLQQLANLGAAPPPLFPVAKPHSPLYPAVYFRDVMVFFG